MKTKVKLLFAFIAITALSGCSSNSINKGGFKLPWGESDNSSEIIQDEVAFSNITEKEVGLSLVEVLTEDGFSLTVEDINTEEKNWVLNNNIVYFDFDSDAINPAFNNLINKQSDFLKNNNLKVILEGHTDERGSNSYNISLGERRAQTVKTILINKGLSESQVEIVSYGELKPASIGGSEIEWAKDRRVVFKYK